VVSLIAALALPDESNLATSHFKQFLAVWSRLASALDDVAGSAFAAAASVNVAFAGAAPMFAGVRLMFALPSNATLLIVRAVASLVAVAALPVIGLLIPIFVLAI
jgi:hypothetical protein